MTEGQRGEGGGEVEREEERERNRGKLRNRYSKAFLFRFISLCPSLSLLFLCAMRRPQSLVFLSINVVGLGGSEFS